MVARNFSFTLCFPQGILGKYRLLPHGLPHGNLSVFDQVPPNGHDLPDVASPVYKAFHRFPCTHPSLYPLDLHPITTKGGHEIQLLFATCEPVSHKMCDTNTTNAYPIPVTCCWNCVHVTHVDEMCIACYHI